MKTKLRFLLVLLLASAIINAGRAAPVELADIAPAVEDVASGDEPFAPWAFAAEDARDPALSADIDAGGVEVQTPTNALPFAVGAASGQASRLSVDATAIREQAEREGWGWREWTVCGVCVVAVAAAAVLIVDATQRGSHTSGDDSSTHYNIGVGGEGNTVHVKIDSPDTSNTRTGY